MGGLLEDLWRYRHFIAASVRNELRSRFVRSKLGGAWLVLNPLVQVAIYTIILSNLLSARLPGIEGQYVYAIYLMAGLLAWNLFNEIVIKCTNLFVTHSNLIKKINFPRIVLPTVAVCAAAVDSFLLLVTMLVLFVLLGHEMSVAMLWLAPLTGCLILLAAGLGMCLSIFNVFVRDIAQTVPLVLQILFWCTPIVYPITILPDSYRQWLELNPVYPIVEAYHQVMVYGLAPNLSSLVFPCLVALCFAALSVFLFLRARAEVVDSL